MVAVGEDDVRFYPEVRRMAVTGRLDRRFLDAVAKFRPTSLALHDPGDSLTVLNGLAGIEAVDLVGEVGVRHVTLDMPDLHGIAIDTRDPFRLSVTNAHLVRLMIMDFSRLDDDWARFTAVEEVRGPWRLPDFDVLAGSTTLERVDVEARRLRSVEALGACPNLWRVDLDALRGLESLAPLRRCPRLSFAKASGRVEDGRLDWLPESPELTGVYLKGWPAIDSLQPVVRSLTLDHLALEGITLRDPRVKDVFESRDWKLFDITPWPKEADLPRRRQAPSVG